MYFGKDVLCQFDAEVLEFDAVFSVQCSMYRGREWLRVQFWDSNRQNTASPKYNDDISLLILQHIISASHLSGPRALSVSVYGIQYDRVKFFCTESESESREGVGVGPSYAYTILSS